MRTLLSASGEQTGLAARSQALLFFFYFYFYFFNRNHGRASRKDRVAPVVLVDTCTRVVDAENPEKNLQTIADWTAGRGRLSPVQNWAFQRCVLRLGLVRPSVHASAASKKQALGKCRRRTLQQALSSLTRNVTKLISTLTSRWAAPARQHWPCHARLPLRRHTQSRN